MSRKKLAALPGLFITILVLYFLDRAFDPIYIASFGQTTHLLSQYPMFWPATLIILLTILIILVVVKLHFAMDIAELLQYFVDIIEEIGNSILELFRR